MTQLLKLSILIICINFITSTPLVREGEESPNYWNELAKKDILKAKSREYLNHRAKNAILFIGDGMGVSTITASRIRKGQLAGQPGEEGYLFFEQFPDNALIKTYNVNKQVPDSAGTATAYLTGVKANFETIGVGPRVDSSETDCKKIQENSVNSFLEEARKSGKYIGVVTTARITHASPAAAYAHAASRNHESDVDLPKVTSEAGCKDIARQLVEEFPGKALNVAFGGGRKYFTPKENGGRRTDGVNLIDKWSKVQAESGLAPEKFKYISTLKELEQLKTEEVEHVLGLFAEDHLSHHDLREKDAPEQPTLTQMTETAIKILSRNDKGFLLFVEAGLVDLANHANNAKQALDDAGELDRAVEKASSMLNRNETLIAVTADHSHGLTITGYPDRGNDILGVTGYVERSTNKSFTTLMYASGPGHQKERLDAVKLTNLTDDNFKQHSTVDLEDANHTGEEVALYANGGPFSHFYNGIHEQNFVAHLISYATCIGLYKEESHCK